MCELCVSVCHFSLWDKGLNQTPAPPPKTWPARFPSGQVGRVGAGSGGGPCAGEAGLCSAGNLRAVLKPAGSSTNV